MNRLVRIFGGIVLCIACLALLGGCVPLMIWSDLNSGIDYVSIDGAAYMLNKDNKTAVLRYFEGDGSASQKCVVPATVKYRRKNYEVLTLGEGGQIIDRGSIGELTLSPKLQTINLSCDLAEIETLYAINVEGNNPFWYSHDGILYRKEGDDCILDVYPAAKKDTSAELCAGYLFTSAEDCPSLWSNPYLQRVTIEQNDRYKSVDGVLYTIDGSEMVLYPINRPDETFTAPTELKLLRPTCRIWDNKHIRHVESAGALTVSGNMLLADGEELVYAVRGGKCLKVPDGVRTVGYNVLSGVQYLFVPSSVAVFLDSFVPDCRGFADVKEIYLEGTVLPSFLEAKDFTADVHFGCKEAEFDSLVEMLG